MTKEELQEKQKAVIEEYNQSIEANPDVKKWISTKRKLTLIAIIYVVAYYIIEYLAYTSVNSEISIGRLVVRAIIAVGWFVLFLIPNANWKANLIFYVSAAYNFLSLIKILTGNIDVGAYFSNGPFLAIFFVMSVAMPFLILALACWLTIPKKNRELSDKAQKLSNVYAENLKAINKEN